MSLSFPTRVAFPTGVRIALLTVMDHGVRYDGGFATETLIGSWHCQFCGRAMDAEMAYSDPREAFCPQCGGEHRLQPIDPHEYAARLEVVR